MKNIYPTVLFFTLLILIGCWPNKDNDGWAEHLTRSEKLIMLKEVTPSLDTAYFWMVSDDNTLVSLSAPPALPPRLFVYDISQIPPKVINAYLFDDDQSFVCTELEFRNLDNEKGSELVIRGVRNQNQSDELGYLYLFSNPNFKPMEPLWSGLVYRKNYEKISIQLKDTIFLENDMPVLQLSGTKKGNDNYILKLPFQKDQRKFVPVY